ncbi:MAG: hypoxanthine phosphoribosyltransferase [Lachnospiraceae bacterium]|nr:hypoxanthine phosphoribosyltransferase [Lachnospiraceae bacterium]
MEQDVDQILISEEEIAKRVKEMGEQITRDYEGKPLILVGILKGANIFMADLARTVRGKVQLDFMVASSYGNGAVSSGQLKIVKDLPGDLTGKHILLVEDIIDTGLTLSKLQSYLLERGASSVKLCTFLDKPDHRKTVVDVDYVGFKVPDEFIIGYGIDYAEFYRNLPYIASLKREIYQ